MKKAIVFALSLFACAPPPAAPPVATPIAIASPSPIPSPIPKTASAIPLPAPATSVPKKKREPRPKPPPKPAAPNAPPPDTLVEELLDGEEGDALQNVLEAPETYRFQVLYGEIKDNKTLVRHGYRADAEYFFPASSMKMPIALATYDVLAKLRKQGKTSLTKDATLKIHAKDPIVTTLARETWKALIVSDNFSANRLLGIVGHREAHEMLWGLGLKSVRINSGFATGAEIDAAEDSPRCDFTVGDKTDELPARKSDLKLTKTEQPGLDIGKAQILDGRKVDTPLSFAEKNAITLRDLQDTLVRIVRPELLPPKSPADTASPEDLAYVKQALGTLPSESGLAGYDRNIVADYQLIPFLRGIERVRAKGKFQIFTKVGQAYGFLIGNAYIVDKETQKAFFLTAAIFANPDEVMNDDIYAYDTISYPALADVAEAITRHALK